MRAEEIPALSVREAASQLDTRADSLLVDVREMNEFTAMRAEGAVLVPLSQFGLRYRELPADRPLLVICRSGNRSAMATDFLLRQGYADVHNVTGGMLAWHGSGLPVRSGPLDPGEGAMPPAHGLAAPGNASTEGS